MPWVTPSLRQCRELVRNDITASLPGSAVVGNTVLRVVADAQAGLARLCLKFLDWLSLQLMPDTAERIWLDRHGQIWLVNSDGSLGRKNATPAGGTVEIFGTPGVIISEGSELISPDGQSYETLEFAIIGSEGSTEVAVRALNPGTAGNQFPGSPFALAVPITGVDTVTVVDVRGGTNTETDEDLRARVLRRIRQPPMGGCAYDYEAWALAIPSVTRAWCAPREMGMGTVTVRFMVDALRADTGGYPLDEDIEIVRDYLNKVRPVAVRDFFVEAPVPEPIDFGLTLTNDSLTLREQVAISAADMIREKSSPAHHVNGELVQGTTIKASWIAEAINRVTNDFILDMDDHPMPHNGSLATLGTITYPEP
jgi:uncharacterized phage protein gp47/JayE